MPFYPQVQIWDTAGFERFRAITQSYYKRADVIVLVYDISDSESFESIPEWLSGVEEKAEGVDRFLIGNKSDCAEADRKIQAHLGKKFAEDNDMPFLETSAKNGNNIHELFMEIAKMHLNKKQSRNTDTLQNCIILEKTEKPKKTKRWYFCYLF